MVLGPNADARPEERMHAEVYRADRHYSGTCLRASGGLLQYRSCCSSVHASSSHCRHCPGCSGTRTSERSSVRLSNRKCWLNVLHRVGIPVASAILALAKPDKYAVIDFRGWRQIFARKKNSFSTRDYLTYLHPGERTVRQ